MSILLTLIVALILVYIVDYAVGRSIIPAQFKGLIWLVIALVALFYLLRLLGLGI